MPNCYQLIPKGNVSNEPETLVKVDEAICKFLNEPVHPTMWAYNWPNTIGFLLTTGKDFDQIEEVIKKYAADSPNDQEYYKQLLKINSFLRDNYQARAWRDTTRTGRWYQDSQQDK